MIKCDFSKDGYRCDPSGWSLERDGAPDVPASDPSGACGACSWARPCLMLDGSTRLVCAADIEELLEVDPSEVVEGCWEEA